MRVRTKYVAILAVVLLAAVVGAILLRSARSPDPSPEPSPAPSAAPAPEPVAAAAGIGDPYFPGAGNAGYDVLGYDIDLRYDPATDQLDGRTAVTAIATAALRSFTLDLRLPASAAQVNDRPATITQEAGELRVTPAEPVPAGAAMRVMVSYAGAPSTIPSPPGGVAPPWTRVPDGAIAVGEPDGAAWWFPANDHPGDKATVAVTVSVPAGVEVVSNGALLGGPEPTPDGRDRWRWRSDEPMASYLAFVAIGQYELVRRDTPLGPYLAAYAPLADTPGARASVEQTPQVIDTLAAMFGPYPFEQLGGVVAPVAGGFALENQTRPVYAPGFFVAGKDGLAVVVHELAHQWFGDNVTPARWRDIWLAEGFATYGEWLYTERTGGLPARETARLTYDRHPADDQFWTIPPGDPGAADLFNIAVYDRGGMALHALRTAIGDEKFFALLKAWQTARADGNGTVEDFLALAERQSGSQLDDLAKEWLYDRDRPPTPPGG